MMDLIIRDGVEEKKENRRHRQVYRMKKAHQCEASQKCAKTSASLIDSSLSPSFPSISTKSEKTIQLNIAANSAEGVDTFFKSLIQRFAKVQIENPK